ncbi:hypothetical protein [Rhodococcus sp. PSBB049]|uniref:hypothetical protein n=1 Tax=Rhodococcus sp. PSBB049 TaxID=2812863 RepID=UPI0019802FC7|nr:hypothetical protein [Rhodococcus sp. PSBB049]QSE72477.1 hypothetical protein JYA91_29615 [Rhodococcus sp. PSBB049]
MTSPATPPNPKNRKTAPATSNTPPATPKAAAPSTKVGALPPADDAGELESVADAASEATEIAAAFAVEDAEPAPAPGIGPASDPTGQFRAVNDNVLATAKLTGALTLDAYENSVRTLLAWEERVGALGGLGWLGELTRAHVALVTSVSEPVFAAARQALK